VKPDEQAVAAILEESVPRDALADVNAMFGEMAAYRPREPLVPADDRRRARPPPQGTWISAKPYWLRSKGLGEASFHGNVSPACY
jgi:hypothetical protein